MGELGHTPVNSSRAFHAGHQDEIDGSSVILGHGVLVLAEEPLNGIPLDEWCSVLTDNQDPQQLADVLAGVWNKTGWIMHDLDDEDCDPTLHNEFEVWYSFQEELLRRIASFLNLEGIPTPYVSWVLPFMEGHGYCNRNGWMMPLEL